MTTSNLNLVPAQHLKPMLPRSSARYTLAQPYDSAPIDLPMPTNNRMIVELPHIHLGMTRRMGEQGNVMKLTTQLAIDLCELPSQYLVIAIDETLSPIPSNATGLPVVGAVISTQQTNIKERFIVKEEVDFPLPDGTTRLERSFGYLDVDRVYGIVPQSRSLFHRKME